MALRTRNRGRTGLKDTALARFGFFAHLRTHVMLAKGVGAASFTRATVATVKDFEGGIRNCLSGEVRFEGQRRVVNLCYIGGAMPTESWNWSGISAANRWCNPSSMPVTTGQTDPNGGTAASKIVFNPPLLASRVIFGKLAIDRVRAYRWTVWMRGETGTEQVGLSVTDTTTWATASVTGLLTLTTTWKRYSVLVAAGQFGAGTNIDCVIGYDGKNVVGPAQNATIYIAFPMIEDATNQANQNPSEYVSVGAAKLNEFTNSEDLTAVASWAPTRTTVTANGYQTLDTVLETAVVNTHELASAAISGISASTAYRLQFECKANGRDESWVQVSDGTQGAYGVFNATTGAFTTAWQGFGAAAFTGCASSIENRGDGVYRVTLDFTTAAATASLTTTFYLYNAGTSYLGDITKGWYLGKLMLRRGTGDYFPVGNVYPYHGACVDGVKYFDTENGNTVSSNVVTEAVGRSLDGYAVGWLPGSSGAYFSTPSAAANQITGNIDIRVRVACDDWTPATAARTLVSKWKAGGNLSYALNVETSGALTFYYSPNGTTARSVTSSAGTGITDGTVAWVRATYDTSGKVNFYKADDSATEPTSWTLIGAADRSITAGNIYAGAQPVEINSTADGASGVFPGKNFRAIIKSGIDGTTAVDFNPREGWTENLIPNSTDLSGWSTFNSATATGNTMTAVLASSYIQTASAAGQQSVLYALRARLSASVDTPCAIRLTDAADGNPVGSLSFNLTTTPQEFEVQCDMASGFSGTLAVLVGGLAPTTCTVGAVITVHGISARRVTVASQRTSSQIIPTSGSALRGWISSTGEQWTIAGAATVLQRQTEGYLPEGATTNLVLQSSNFGATWDSTGGGTPTRSAAAAYVGDVALDLLGDDDAGTAEYFRQVVTFTADASKSVSFVVKQGSATTSLFKLSDDTAAAARMTCEVTWSNGVPVATFSVGSQERQPEALANGGYRIFGLATGVVAANTNRIYVYPANTAAGSAAATGNIYIGGVQAENATVASSLQPTTTATVARNADVLTWPAAGNYGATANTLYGEMFRSLDAGAYQGLIEVDDGSNNNRNALGIKITDTAECYVRSGSADQADVNSAATMSVGSLHKLASVVYANYANVAADGVLSTADTTVTIPVSPTTIRAGDSSASTASARGPIKNLRVARVIESNTDIVTISR